MHFSFRQAIFHVSAFESAQLIPDQGAEIAFVGRSNSGKSSAINCLTDQKGLCKTSKLPGRTQLINFFRLEEAHHLVDLPGYGFAKVSKKMRAHWNQMLSDYLLHRAALKGLIVTVDIRRGVSALDQTLLDMIDNRIPIHILLTKSDKLSQAAMWQTIRQTQQQLGDQASTSSLSVLSRQGLPALEKKCCEWFGALEADKKKPC